ncbi:MAG TPA: tetratricopeptide repeat protein [Pseudolabrys sp.]|nr:tetratricopeptide repeat protein [Pseudolabrys sp.]
MDWYGKMTSPAELINKAIFFHQRGNLGEAEAIYKKVLHVHAKNFDALHMLGIINAQRGLFDEAEKLVRKALSVDSKIAQCFHNYGTILAKLQRFEEAVSNYNKAIKLAPNHAPIYADLGIALNILKRYEEEIAAYDKILSLEPNFTGVEGARLYAKMHLCDWNNFDTECSHLISSVRNGKGNTLPFQILAIPSTSNDQLRCAKQHIANNFLLSEKPIWQGERYNHKRIRVAYLSADFRQHAGAYLMAGLFEQHDRSRFEIIGVSFGVDDRSEIRKRLVVAFDEFYDVRTKSDQQVAKLLHDLQIDIAIDRSGYTQGYKIRHFCMSSSADSGELSRLPQHNGDAVHRLHHR